MTKKTPTPEAVVDVPGLRTIRRGNLRCVIADLNVGGVCLYSPVEKTSAAFPQTDDVRYLFAPNHYHNKGIAEHAKAFQNAQLVSSNAARPRLEKVTGCRFGDLSGLRQALPDCVSLAEPEGLKTGEVWMIVRAGAEIVWVVTDTFYGLLEKDDARARPGFLKTFPTYGLKDKQRFSDWVRQRLAEEVPTMIVPCHGETVRGAALDREIDALLETL
ncbi:hypothetical protein [Roseibium sp. MMSF_3412]|uniref:hypothetical protein n=1 Tax=Roseibium sp. MMSF_3412 TaxID=3046712 RepID=UPI00273EDCA0|nr:hypothetical protein [Roseibium sp. MMSF_3412]